jgi:hypothetical protein
MQTAHEQGTLVLLQNLDPSYTSAEVEVILILKFIFFTSLSSSIPSCFTSQPCCSKTLHVQFSYGKVDISTPPPLLHSWPLFLGSMLAMLFSVMFQVVVSSCYSTLRMH